MKNNRSIIGFIICVAVALFLWDFLHQKAVVEPVGAAVNSSLDDQSNSVPSVGKAPGVQGASDSVPESVRIYMENKKADPGYDWKQPICFYGEVVDESNQPVQGASVHFTWNDLSERGISGTNTVTDTKGLFSFAGHQGKRLYVEVAKDGYYSSQQNRLGYEYANPADGLFTPDIASPVVFHLRKKGAGVDLITSQSGIKNDFGVKIPLDGTPVLVDLLKHAVGPGGQLILSQSKPDHENWQRAAKWAFRMKIPDGGFVEQNDDFPFQAPNSGYLPIQEFDFDRGQTNWAMNLQKDYYIRFGNPPRYGRLHLETSISMDGVRLTYAINPDGSQNLEPAR